MVKIENRNKESNPDAIGRKVYGTQQAGKQQRDFATDILQTSVERVCRGLVKTRSGDSLKEKPRAGKGNGATQLRKGNITSCSYKLQTLESDRM